MSYTRKEISEREGIRLPYVCPAITASTFIIVDLSGNYEKYKPFDCVYVFNNSTSLVYVYINQDVDKCYPIAGKTEKKIDNVYIHDLKIEEKSAANILAAEIVLTLEKTGATADTLAKQIARKVGW